MDLSQYEDFKQALASGNKAAAASFVRPFISSFASLEGKVTWSRWYFENERFGHRIRHEIYEGIIFPALLDGYKNSDPWSIKWLARTAQNLYSAKQLWAQIGGKTEEGLLRQLFALCPTDVEVRVELLSNLIKSFEYMIHEWPAGILYSHNGATAEECLIIHADIDFARQLDVSFNHLQFLDDFSDKLCVYQKRIGRHDV